MQPSTQERINTQVTTHPVVLYMKGTPDFPQCGFSRQVVQMLESCDIPFLSVNVLDDPEVREGIKVYGKWPTIPQLYIQGELVGGCDIVAEMYQSGKLQTLLGK